MGITVALDCVRQVNKSMLGKLINGRCPRVFSQGLFKHILYSNGVGLYDEIKLLRK
jgi:hypothetical protein